MGRTRADIAIKRRGESTLRTKVFYIFIYLFTDSLRNKKNIWEITAQNCTWDYCFSVCSRTEFVAQRSASTSEKFIRRPYRAAANVGARSWCGWLAGRYSRTMRRSRAGRARGEGRRGQGRHARARRRPRRPAPHTRNLFISSYVKFTRNTRYCI